MVEMDMVPGSNPVHDMAPGSQCEFDSSCDYFLLFYLFSCVWDQGFLVGLRRQYNLDLAPCGCEQSAE